MKPASHLAAFVIASAMALAAQGQTGPAVTSPVSAALRLSTLAERIAKLHAQVGQNILPERSRKALQDSIRDFDATLRGVARRASTAESRDNYALLALLWHDYRDWATRTATRENARRLRPRTEEVVWVASKGARMLQAEARGAANASAVRASGAATLAQRVAKLYLWERWDIRDETLARELRESEENLRRALEALHETPARTREIADELQSADIQMRFMEDAARAIRARDPTSRPIEFMAKTADHIQESMERLALLYEGP